MLEEYVFARHTHLHDMAWYGEFSSCHSGGAIVQVIKETIHGLPKPIRFVLTMADGYSAEPNSLLAVKDRDNFESNIKGPDTIVGVLCTRNFHDPRALLMPLDDESFIRGVVDMVGSRVSLPPWEDRKPIAYWRGTLSGGNAPTLRTQTVWELFEFPHADAKFSRDNPILMVPERQGRFIYTEDNRFYDDRRGLDDHVKNKYILVLDGNCIASSHQWVFASGSVPIMVTHPDNNYWFKKYLKPGVHYVSVKYDLSDLREKIEWLVNNDAEAKQIANNAMEFAKTVLSSEFQHGHLVKEIRRFA